MATNKLQAGRKDAFLDKKRWRHKGKEISWRERVADLALTGKTRQVETLSRVKVAGAYAKLGKPRADYFLLYQDGAEEWLLKVPKIVWDDVIAVER